MASQDSQQQHLATQNDQRELIALVGRPTYAALRLLPGSLASVALKLHPYLELAWVELVHQLSSPAERVHLIHDHVRMMKAQQHQVRKISSIHIDAMTAAGIMTLNWQASETGQFLITRANQHKKAKDD